MIRFLLALPFVLTFCYLLQVNLRLYHTPLLIEDTAGRYNADVLAHLQYIKSQVHGTAGKQMQQLYPEGFVFLHALYGLSWTELLQEVTPLQTFYEEGMEEVRWSIEQLESDEAKAIFTPKMSPPYGVFYQGWLNYLRANYLALLPFPQQDSTQYERYEVACSAIATALSAHHQPFLFSYPGGCWPADNIVALAALAKHDHLARYDYRDRTTYDATCQNWLNRIQSKVDVHGLIPHSVTLQHGAGSESARGSSQSLMLAFLMDIDSSFARQQYEIYKDKFVDYRFGLPGIREHPKGISSGPDIDSGPVILDIGGAASIVGMGTAAQYGEVKLYTGLRNSIEGFGAAFTSGNRKRHLGGQLAIADAFIAWSNARAPLEMTQQRAFSKWRFHMWSMVVLLPLGWLMLQIFRWKTN